MEIWLGEERRFAQSVVSALPFKSCVNLAHLLLSLSLIFIIYNVDNVYTERLFGIRINYNNSKSRTFLVV